MLINPGHGGPGLSIRLQQATFIDWSPLGNVSKYIKNGGVLMTSKWGCGVQEVLGKDPDGPAVSDGS